MVAGTTAMELSVGAVALTVTVPFAIFPDAVWVAVMVAVPGATPVAIPDVAPTVATPRVEETKVDPAVRLAVEESL